MSDQARSGHQYIAHVKLGDNDTYQLHHLTEHLKKTASLAEKNAAACGAGEWAKCAGLWHDLGKYSEEFQHYIKSASGYDVEAHIETTPGKVNHSDAGAQYAVEQFGVHGRIIAYLIAGHHAGLPDWYKLDAPGGALQQRLQETQNLTKALAADIPPEILEQPCPQSPISPGGSAGFALWVRMLFSALVDADFLDTESFMDEGKSAARSQYPAFKTLLPDFNRYMQALTANAESTAVNQLRGDILQQCREAASQPPGLFSLTVPTRGDLSRSLDQHF